MEIDNHTLDTPPTAAQLRHLAKNNVMTPKALERGLIIINHTPDREKWERFLSILLLVLGSGFIISGIFFFFAFNWADLHPFAKLGLLQVVVLVAVGLAYWRGLDNLSGKIALGAASLFVGALIAVYGQIYQTGADSYQLFLTWALLIIGWVLIGKFTPLWFTWVLLLDLSLIFYWIQIFGDVDIRLYFAIFLLNGGSLLGWEIAHSKGIDWLKSRWTPRLLSLPTFTVLLIPTISLILYFDRDPWLLFMLGLFIATSAAVLYIYSQKILDLFLLMICALSLMIAFDTWMVNALENLDELLLFVLSGMVIGEAALVVIWLRRVSKMWEERRS